MANINPIDEAGIDGSKASFEDTINYKQTARESHRLLEDEEQCTNLQEGSHEEIIAAGESTKKESADNDHGQHSRGCIATTAAHNNSDITSISTITTASSLTAPGHGTGHGYCAMKDTGHVHRMPVITGKRDLGNSSPNDEGDCIVKHPYTSTSVSGDEDANEPPEGDEPFEAPLKSSKTSVDTGVRRSTKKSTFQCPRCNSKKKAVIIGINYTKSRKEHPLKKCVNDAIKFKDFICEYYGFSEKSDIKLLIDENDDDAARTPTRENIISAMKWLVEGAKEDHSLVFFYSGHGAQVPDKDGDEEDGLDEIIIPSDEADNGYILDDEMFKIMAEKLPSGCRLTALFNMCHSGSALDLPFSVRNTFKLSDYALFHTDEHDIQYTSKGRIEGNTVVRTKIEQNHNHLADELRRLGCEFEYMDVFSQEEFLELLHNDYKSSKAKKRVSKGDVFSWGSCKDSEKCRDTGLLTQAFIESLKLNRNQTYHQLLDNIRSYISRNPGHDQTVQLSSSHSIDTREVKFEM